MPGQQIVDIAHSMSACHWIDAAQLCRFDQRGEDGPALTAGVPIPEERVLSR